MEEAPADFHEHFDDDFGSLGLERLTTEPAAFRSKLTGVMMWKNIWTMELWLSTVKHWTEL